MSQIITFYTDGSCSNRTGIGGCGVLAIKKRCGITSTYEIFQGFDNTKTGRQEIYAVIYALESVPDEERKNTSVVIYSDSQYIVNSISKGWYREWISMPLDRKNIDLWKIFAEIRDSYPNNAIVIKWVKGHSGNQGNERADELANMGRLSANHIDDGQILTEWKRKAISLKG